MTALTIKQPFAAWIADGHKKIEIRSWKTDYRGELLITAASSPKIITRLDSGETIALPTGCAVCVVNLLDCRPALPSDSEMAMCDICNASYAWIFGNIKPVYPLKTSGQQRLWQYKGDIKYLLPNIDWLDASFLSQNHLF